MAPAHPSLLVRFLHVSILGLDELYAQGSIRYRRVFSNIRQFLRQLSLVPVINEYLCTSSHLHIQYWTPRKIRKLISVIFSRCHVSSPQLSKFINTESMIRKDRLSNQPYHLCLSPPPSSLESSQPELHSPSSYS